MAHQIQAKQCATAAPSQGIGGSNAVGTSTSLSRSDHDHTIRETGGPTNLTVGVVTDGQFLKRSGTAIIGSAPPGTLSTTVVTATGTITTTSTTDVLATNMTATPEAGTYLCFFTGSIYQTTADSTHFLTMSLWFDASSQISGSAVRAGDGVGFPTPFCCVGIVTVNGSQAIEGHWHMESGSGTASMLGTRTLTLVKIG